MKNAARSILCTACFASVAQALPTMVRLGYPNCVSCHVSPQGGGLLNEYGRGIDEAQSLRGGEYKPGVDAPLSALALGGRLDQDFRIVLSDAASAPAGSDWTNTFRARFYYRSVFRVGKGLRFTATAAGENDSSPRPALAYDPSVRPGQAFLGSALVQYRPREGMEVAAGIDQLPMGVYTGDLATLVKARNRLGLYDTPLQAKLMLWRKRWQVMPYAYAPRGSNGDTARERGGGVLAEYDLLGKGKTVIGVNLVRGSGSIEERNMAGVYTRLGFGRWGILAEHDLTRRTYAPVSAAATRFGQAATYSQVFYAFREWLVGSAILERLTVADPFPERRFAARGELSVRLSSNFTLGVRAGAQLDRRTGQTTPVVTMLLAWKTVGLRPW